MRRTRTPRAFARMAIAAVMVGSSIGFASSAMAGDSDVRDTPPARAAADILERLAQGNEGSGGWESLTLNRKSRTVEGTAYVRSRHVWVIKTPFGKKKVVAYDWKVKAHVKLDLRNGNTSATIDFGRGIKVRARDLIAVLSAL